MNVQKTALVVLALFVLTSGVARAGSATWNNFAVNVWLNAGNWNPSSSYPGVSGTGSNTDVATFDTVAISGNSCGIDLPTLTSSTLSLGSFLWNYTTAAGFIGNSSTTAAGTLRLNGATVNVGGTGGSIDNLLVGVGDSATQNLTVQNTGGSGNKTMSVALNNANGVFYVTGSKTLTISSPISSVASGNGFTKSGAGTMILSGANTYTGPTTVSSGTLQAGVATSAFGSKSAITVNNGATLSFNGFSQTVGSLSGGGNITMTAAAQAVTINGTSINATFSGNITGGSTSGLGLQSSFTGIQTLSGQNTYLGWTTLASGTLNVGSPQTSATVGPLGGNTGTGGISWAGGTLQYSAANQYDYSSRFGTNGTQTYKVDVNGQTVTWATGLINGGGSLTLSDSAGGGTLRITAANTYAGATTINGGTLQLGNAGTAGSLSLSSAITIASGATLAVKRTDTVAQGSHFSGAAITGQGGFTQAGTGTTVLNAVNTYSGPTTISAGTLVGVADGSCANSDVTLNSGTSATLGIAGATDNTKQWTCKSLTTAGTSPKLEFGFATAPSTTFAPLNITGDCTFTTTPTITLDASSLTAGTYPLIVVSGTPDTATPTVTIVGNAGTLAVSGGVATWGGDGNKTLSVTLTGASTQPLKWKLNGNGNWDINTTFNWKDNSGTDARYQDGVACGDSVVFDETYGTAAKTITLNVPVKPASLTINNPNGAVTISGTGRIGGSTGLTKSGAGVLTIDNAANANYYTGKTLVSGGVLRLGTGYGNSDTIPGGISSANPGYGSNLEINGGNVRLAYFLKRTLGSGPGQLQISGGTSGFSHIQSDTYGRLSINNDNNYEVVWGSTYFQPTVLELNNSVAVPNQIVNFQNKLDLNGADRTVAANSTTAADAGRTDANNYYMTTCGGVISGVIRNSQGTPAGLIKTGLGELLLAAANTFDGPVTVNAGTLSVAMFANGGVASGLGQSSSAAANLLLGNGTTMRLRSTAVGSVSCNRAFTINGTAAGDAATLDASGTGPLNLTNTGSPAYGTADQTRTLNLTGSNTGNNTLAAAIADNGAGAVSMNKSGAGSWVLSGTSTYSGATTISGGKLIGIAGGGCANSAITVNNTAGCTLGVVVNDNLQQWTCASLTSVGTSATLAFGFNTAPSPTLAPLNVTGTLTFTGIPAITVDPANLVSGQSYPLLTCGGTAPSGTPTVTIGRGLTGTTSWTGNTLYLNVSGTSTQPLKWGLVGSGNWDINTSTSWKDSTGTSVKYLDGVSVGDPVVLDDSTATSLPTLTLNTLVKPASVTINTTLGYTISGTGGIIGNAAITKSGSGTLTLSTANTFSGGFTLTAGTVGSIPSGTFNGFGTGTVTINGGKILVASGANATIPNTMKWNANFIVDRGASSTPTINWNENITLGANVTVAGSAAGGAYIQIFNGGILDDATGGRSLSFTTVGVGGRDTITLNGNNTFTGNFSIDKGALTIGGSGKLGGGDYSGNISISTTADAPITYSSSSDQILRGIISGVSGLTKNTSSTSVLTLSGQNIYSGATAINAGTLRVVTGNGTRCTSAIAIANTAGCTFGVHLAAANGQWASSSTLTVAGTNSVIEIDYGSTAPTTSTTQDPIKVTTLTVSGVGTVKILGDIKKFRVGGVYPLINGTTAVPGPLDPYEGLNLILPTGMTGHLVTISKHVQLVVDTLPPQPTIISFY